MGRHYIYWNVKQLIIENGHFSGQATFYRRLTTRHSRNGSTRDPIRSLTTPLYALRENNEDVALWPFTDMANDREQVIRINPSLASNEGRVIKEWALAGLGIIMRSEWDVKPQIDSGQLVRLLPDDALPDANIVALVGSAKQERSARIAGFLSLLKTPLSSVPWQPLNKDT